MSEYDLEGFKQELSLRESGGRHAAQNELGYVGRYQIGEHRLSDYNRVSKTNHTIDDYLQSPELQDEVQDWHVKDIDAYIDTRGLAEFIGQDFNGVKLSRNSLRAVAHLGGRKGLKEYLVSRGGYDPADANGTRLSDYAVAFANVRSRAAPEDKTARGAESVSSSSTEACEKSVGAPFDKTALLYPKEAVDWARRDNTLGRNLPIGEREGLRFRVSRDRTPESLTRILQWLDVARSERYRAQGDDTFCNVYASDFCYLAGVYLPRVWGMDQPLRVRRWDRQPMRPSEMTANALFDWLHTYGDGFGWRQVDDLDALQGAANSGCCGLVVAKSVPHRHGHISIVCPETNGSAATRKAGVVTEIVQSQTASAQGEVSARSDWWDQPQFMGFGFWVNERHHWPCDPLRPNTLLSALCKLLKKEDCAYLDAKLAIHRDEVRRLPDPPDALFQALVASEDKRFFSHPGFDFLAILRAVYRFCSKRKVEGASTIEQQLVRTITGHKDRSFRRKMTEILLAMRCSSGLDKRTIALIYMDNAYFGWRATGFQNALKRPEFVRETEAETAATLAASLRFPMAQTESDKRRMARDRRIAFILDRMNKDRRTPVQTASNPSQELPS